MNDNHIVANPGSRRAEWRCDQCGGNGVDDVIISTTAGDQLCGRCVLGNQSHLAGGDCCFESVVETINLRSLYLSPKAVVWKETRNAVSVWAYCALLLPLIFAPMALALMVGIAEYCRIIGTLIGITFVVCACSACVQFLLTLTVAMMSRRTRLQRVSLSVSEQCFVCQPRFAWPSNTQIRSDQCEWYIGIPWGGGELNNCQTFECICITYEKTQFICGLNQTTRTVWESVLTSAGCRRVVGVERGSAVFWRILRAVVLLKMGIVLFLSFIAFTCIDAPSELLRVADLAATFCAILWCAAAYVGYLLRGRTQCPATSSSRTENATKHRRLKP